MDELMQAMSIADLRKFKTTYKGNESVTKIIDGYIEVKVKVEAQVVAKAQFTDVVEAMINKLPHPETIHNIYMRWAEIEVEDEEAEAVEVMIDGETEMRKPKHKEFQWIVELNKGFTVGKAKGDVTAGKRAVTVFRRDGNNLVLVGNFPTGSKACEFMELDEGKGSANKFLRDEGFIVDTYTGTDYTIK